MIQELIKGLNKNLEKNTAMRMEIDDFFRECGKQDEDSLYTASKLIYREDFREKIYLIYLEADIYSSDYQLRVEVYNKEIPFVRIGSIDIPLDEVSEMKSFKDFEDCITDLEDDTNDLSDLFDRVCSGIRSKTGSPKKIDWEGDGDSQGVHLEKDEEIEDATIVSDETDYQKEISEIVLNKVKDGDMISIIKLSKNEVGMISYESDKQKISLISKENGKLKIERSEEFEDKKLPKKDLIKKLFDLIDGNKSIKSDTLSVISKFFKTTINKISKILD